MILYHVTPTANSVSIHEEGIDPEYSKGQRKVCWYVSDAMLMWAIAHVSARHSVPASLISVFCVELIEAEPKRTRWNGVFTCQDVVKPISVFSAYEATMKTLEQAQEVQHAEQGSY